MLDTFYKGQLKDEVLVNAASLICEAMDRQGIEVVLDGLGCIQLLDNIAQRMLGYVNQSGHFCNDFIQDTLAKLKVLSSQRWIARGRGEASPLTILLVHD